ncbi:769_t:CDS:2 [Entrophospora sp. SA101]|nr:769_t:CDS:2 [Entrophospora sp. SA101]
MFYSSSTKIQGECSEDSLSVYTEVVNILQRLDLGTIEVKTPIASGVIDLTGSEDPFVKLLSFGAKQILSRHSFHTTKLPNQISTMLNEFRQLDEKEQNKAIIRENINFILGKCSTKIQGECSEDSLSVYTEVVNILQRLDLGTIEVKTPIASGVIDLTGSEDPFVKLLSFGAKQILSRHSFHTTKLPNQISTMLNEFVSSYSDFRIDFDPALMQPISFPQGEVSLETRRILMTTFDLLEGLRHIWSCRPLLTEDDYSENAYVRADRKENPDLQILLKIGHEGK